MPSNFGLDAGNFNYFTKLWLLGESLWYAFDGQQGSSIWLVRTQASTSPTLSLGITPLTGTWSFFLTLRLVLSCGGKRASRQMLSVLCTAHPSHFSISKFQFLSPQISDTTMPRLGLCCGPEIASRHKPGTTLGLISFVSLLWRVLELYCPCVVSTKSYFIDFVCFSGCLQQERKCSPSRSLTSGSRSKSCHEKIQGCLSFPPPHP